MVAWKLRRVVVLSALAASMPLVSNSVLAADELHFPADRPVDLVHLELNLRIDISKKSAVGSATIDLTALRDASSIRFDAVDFDVKSVAMTRGDKTAPVDYLNDGESITLLLDKTPMAKGDKAQVVIDYSILEPTDGLHFFGPTEDEPDTPYVVWSQGEAITNRYWIPCFDHPDEMQTTEMVVTVDKGNEAISNGRLVSKKDNDDGTVTFDYREDEPYSSYLVTLIVGEFAHEQDTWRGKPVIYYVPKDQAKDLRRSFDNTTRMLEYFSNTFGVEYPWEKYVQTVAYGFGGGMENASATTLGPRTLHDKRAHLDYSSDGLVSHEMGHQWFGDLVTCKDWAHLWLNEGFATYCADIWDEYDLGKDEYDYDIIGNMRQAIKGGKKKPVVDRSYKNPGEMFDARAYPKGASILHMLRERLGDKAFWGGVKAYLTKHAHTPVETSDFRQALEDTTGRSLERFFYDWTQRPGAPTVKASYNWDEDDGLAEITIDQTQDEDAFYFPMVIELRFEDGTSKTIRRDITEKSEKFYIPLDHAPHMVLFDPGLAVLMDFSAKKPRDAWAAQLTEAPRVASRVRAAEHFGEAGGVKSIELLSTALPRESFWGVGAEIAKAIGKAGGDHARDALLANLNVAHPKVRRQVVQELGAFHGDQKVMDALAKVIRQGDPSYLVEAGALRSYGKLQPESAGSLLASLLSRDSHQERIRSAALGAMGALADDSGFDTLIDWTKPGKPWQCRSAAIGGLSTLHKHAVLSDAQTTEAAEVIAACTKSTQRRLKDSAISALRDMGDSARPTLPVLQAIAANDPSDRARDAAKTAIEKIEAGEPARVQLDDLRKQLDELKKNNEHLKDEIEKVKAKGETQGEEKGEAARTKAS